MSYQLIIDIVLPPQLPSAPRLTKDKSIFLLHSFSIICVSLQDDEVVKVVAGIFTAPLPSPHQGPNNWWIPFAVGGAVFGAIALGGPLALGLFGFGRLCMDLSLKVWYNDNHAKSWTTTIVQKIEGAGYFTNLTSYICIHLFRVSSSYWFFSLARCGFRLLPSFIHLFHVSSSDCFLCSARCGFRLLPSFRWDASLWGIYSDVTFPSLTLSQTL